MTSHEQQRNNEPQAQPAHAARSHERPKGATTPHAHAATQAERAVMHPATGTGPDDYFDPDWRCYYAAVA